MRYPIADSGQTTYAYDNVGNLQSFAYPNGVTTAYTYNNLNRLTQMGAGKNGTLQANYVYTLGAAGNRLSLAELGGRTVNYGYDSLYRLTSEAVTNDPSNHNNTTQYQYDNVGNRQQLIVNGTTANVYTYDADDRLSADQYDPNGNTVSSLGTANVYDFENHLIQHGTQPGAVTIVYDGDGNRVSETVAGVTTQYLVDTQNPTGYAQVVDEIQNGSVTRTYSWGLELISKLETGNSKRSFYGFDGHGSVRFLTDSTGAVTDTYDYDAFGNLINSTGSTPNNYLFAGEEYDPALGLYYNRARYLNTSTGRFWSMDTFEGSSRDPVSLHKYLYANADPVNKVDRSGHEIDELAEEETIDEGLQAGESDIEETAEKGVEQELRPVTLVHVTSATNAKNINIAGLSALEYPDVVTPSTGIPGAFYAIGFSTSIPYPVEEVIQFAASFVFNVRFGNSTALAGMVGSLPGPVFQSLKASGAIIQNQLGVMQELICLPDSFPTIDEYNRTRWVIIPLI